MLKMDMKARIAKKILPLMIGAVLWVSLLSIASAEDFGCACHADISKNFSTSLHYTGAGMKGEYERGAAKEFAIDMDKFYADRNCSKCHATTCEKCHGENPHEEDLSKSIETCDRCHLKKQAGFVGDTPGHKDKGPHADIHYEKGLICADCHTAEEMHGDGVEYGTMLLAVKTECEDCHMSPGKTVRNMSVTQYSTDIDAHRIHENKLDCTACHSGWMPTCVNCHLDTGKPESITVDEFYLAKAADGKIKPFVKMTAIYDSATHTGWAEWFPHTVTDEAKDCAFCHENKEVLCEGCEGQILGPGGSFIPQETIDRIYGMAMPITTPTAMPTTPTPTAKPPGFELIIAMIAIAVVVYLMRRR